MTKMYEGKPPKCHKLESKVSETTNDVKTSVHLGTNASFPMKADTDRDRVFKSPTYII